MKTVKRIAIRRRAGRRLSFGGVSLFLALATSLPAATFNWDAGGGGSDTWSSAGNWNPDGAPPNDGTADLVFNVNAGTSPLVDSTPAGSAWSIFSITFGPSAGVFTIFGDPISLRF